jgi:hypothetical protein
MATRSPKENLWGKKVGEGGVVENNPKENLGQKAQQKT